MTAPGARAAGIRAPGPARVAPAWLDLRESADAAARAPELLAPLRHRATGRSGLEVHDLGCGTGAMGRWLAARLPGPQHWVMYDHDPDLLHHAATGVTGTTTAADGAPVAVATRVRDVTTLVAGDLAGAWLVTASALLDLLTRDEVDRIADACVAAACPALITMSVVGRVALTPPDPLDREIAAAFDAHQRRRVGGLPLLGPDAVDAAVEAFTRRGATVLVRPSAWRLGPRDHRLIGAWLRGWVAAACEQSPALAVRAAGYLDRRLAAVAAGGLRVVVGHRDLLAQPGDAGAPGAHAAAGPVPNRSDSA